MKYVLIVGDGMADHPQPELNNQTPLEAASITTMDGLAKKGTVGTVHTLVDGMPYGSDIANLAVLGYNPAQYYSGRSPLEAANIGIDLGDKDVAFRCNFVTVKKEIMEDYSAGHISTEEAKLLIKMLNQKLGSDKLKFYTGTSYRHCLVWNKGPLKAKCTPPHDISGQSIKAYMPKGSGHLDLIRLMEDSQLLLSGHEINRDRRSEGKAPATMIWLWGQGTKPQMPRLSEKYNISGTVISAVDLIKGIGHYAGLNVAQVPGATGYLDTNYAGKVDAALNALKKEDFVFVHIEAPDECGHQGYHEGKIKAIEDLDRQVVKPITEGLAGQDFRLLLMPDHPTPLELKTHTNEAVPFVLFDSTKEQVSSVKAYTEAEAKATQYHIEKGYQLFHLFLTGHLPDQA